MCHFEEHLLSSVVSDLWVGVTKFEKRCYISSLIIVSCPELAIQSKGVKSMTKEVRTYNRYSICFKEKVVQEVSSGASISEVSRRYGIKGSATVQGWIKKFGREELLNKVVRIEMKGEQDRLKTLEKELQATKIALAEKAMVLDALETLIEKVNRHYSTDVKKILDRNSKTGTWNTDTVLVLYADILVIVATAIISR
jgi:transposase-like protein